MPQGVQKEAPALEMEPEAQGEQVGGFLLTSKKVPAAQSVILAHVGDNNSEYTLSQWAPTVMLTVLNGASAHLPTRL